MNVDACAREVGAILAGDEAPAATAQQVASAVRRYGGYRWVGLYAVLETEFCVVGWSGLGAPAHSRFPVTQGLNGAAVSSGTSLVCNDVSSDPRYLTTFESTGSELIVPVYDRDGVRIVGTIDVEADELGAFGDRERLAVERLASSVAPLFEAQPPRT